MGCVAASVLDGLVDENRKRLDLDQHRKFKSSFVHFFVHLDLKM